MATRLLRRQLSPRIAGGLVFLLAIVIAESLVWQIERHTLADEREYIAHVATDNAHTIEHTIDHTLSATYALAIQVMYDKGRVLDFDWVAKAMLEHHPNIAMLGLAPDGIIRRVAPLSGNERAIGLDLLNTPIPSKEARLARDSRQLTLAGPLELVQGGTGIVGRLPVFIDDENGRAVFWGFTLAVIRLPEGLDLVQLAQLDKLGLAYVLWRTAPDNGQKQVIARSALAIPGEPVETTVTVPNASWTLSVAPAQGWGHPLRLSLRAGLALFVSLLLGYLAKTLLELKAHKRQLEKRVAQRTAEILMVQRKLRATLDAIPDLVWLKDADGVYLSCNPMFERFFGASEADISGKTDYDFVGREQADFFRENDRTAMQAGKPSSNEEWLTFANDGSRRLFETIKTPILDADSIPIGVLGIARDITTRVEAEHALLESRQRAQQYLNMAGVMLVVLDTEGRIQLVNRKGCEILGMDEADILGKGFEHFLPERIRREMMDGYTQALADDTGLVEHMESPVLRSDGTERKVAWNQTFLRDEAGRVNGVLSAGEDITESRRVEQALRDSRERLQLLLDSMAEAAYGVDADGNCTFVNRAFLDMLGYPDESEVLGRNTHTLIHHTHADGRPYPESECRMFSAYRAKQTINVSDEVFWRKDGTAIPVEYWSSPLVEDGAVVGAIATFVDVSQRKLAQERIQRLAHFDPLTGLPNRTLLNDRASHDLSSAQRHHAQLAVMFVDLDHFKNINDTLGHRIGDALLIAVATRMKSDFREVDTVSRQGGDEFVLILPDTDANGAAHVAEKLLEAIAQPYEIEGFELSVTLSIGIALFPGDGEDFETLSKCADAAMYRAKHDGRNTYRFFTPEMHAHSAQNLHMENDLRRVLERKQLLLHYQPQISLHDGCVVGVEALLRWQHPELGMISPDEFIPIAEESGQILPIGEWALRSAVRQMKAWMDAGLPPMVVAVNLSAVQFRHPHLPELVTQILDEEKLAPQYLELELTESAAMEDAPAAIAVMDRLHACGIRMSIDDFGTGYSSLSYLKRFKVYKLKVDQSFVRDIGQDPEDRAIVVAIINLARSLGLQTIAEGVETEEQLAFLREQGCHEAQGYYFSKPLPSDELEAFVRLRDV